MACVQTMAKASEIRFLAPPPKMAGLTKKQSSPSISTMDIPDMDMSAQDIVVMECL
jgi:hypothetical protein